MRPAVRPHNAQLVVSPVVMVTVSWHHGSVIPTMTAVMEVMKRTARYQPALSPSLLAAMEDVSQAAGVAMVTMTVVK